MTTAAAAATPPESDFTQKSGTCNWYDVSVKKRRDEILTAIWACFTPKKFF